MIRKHWKILVVTSVIIILPMLAGLILWDQLPGQMPTHWSASGEVNGWSSKAFAVFAMPGLLLGAQWLCFLGSMADPKKANHPQKILHLVLWIIPVLSAVLHTITYATALGYSLRIEVIMPILIGLLFAVIGNYMPKCKQNYTIGIKLPWTLHSEENWNKTHRFAGWLWTACGIAAMFTGFLGGIWAFLGIVAVMVLAPTLYSFILHRKGI